MSVFHALVIAANLLLAVVAFIAGSRGRRVQPRFAVLAASFLALGLADFTLAADGGVAADRIATILVLDVLLVVVLSTMLASRERSAEVR